MWSATTKPLWMTSLWMMGNKVLIRPPSWKRIMQFSTLAIGQLLGLSLVTMATMTIKNSNFAASYMPDKGREIRTIVTNKHCGQGSTLEHAFPPSMQRTNVFTQLPPGMSEMRPSNILSRTDMSQGMPINTMVITTITADKEFHFQSSPIQSGKHRLIILLPMQLPRHVGPDLHQQSIVDFLLHTSYSMAHPPHNHRLVTGLVVFET